MVSGNAVAITFLIIIIVVGIFIYYLDSKLKKVTKEKELNAERYSLFIQKKDAEFLQVKTEQERKIAELKLNVNIIAKQEFEKFKENELEEHRKIMKEAALSAANQWLAEWKIVEEKK